MNPKVQLFLQLDRDIGTLIGMFRYFQLSDLERDTLTKIVDRMDAAMPELQKILYPQSVKES